MLGGLLNSFKPLTLPAGLLLLLAGFSRWLIAPPAHHPQTTVGSQCRTAGTDHPRRNDQLGRSAGPAVCSVFSDRFAGVRERMVIITLLEQVVTQGWLSSTQFRRRHRSDFTGPRRADQRCRLPAIWQEEEVLLSGGM